MNFLTSNGSLLSCPLTSISGGAGGGGGGEGVETEKEVLMSSMAISGLFEGKRGKK